MKKIIALLAPLLVLACASAGQTEAESFVRDGQEIAQNDCASCHAIGRVGVSPNPAAPRFVGLLERYRPEALELDLIEGIRVAHAMPEFQFNPVGADALIAYMRSVQTEGSVN